MKILIATPAFDGKVNVQYALSFADTVSLLARHNIPVEYRITASGSLLCAERNRLMKYFMESDCTHILCIDSDLGWPPIAALALIDYDLDFVAGCYPARREKSFIFRPTYNPNNSLIIKDNKLIKMEYIPAGFMLIKKDVIKKMQNKFPELYFEPTDPALKDESGFALFNTEIWQGQFWGEDYYFCRKAREAGIEIWVDPFIEFDHAGTTGMLLNVLTNNKSLSIGTKNEQPASI